MSFTIRWKLNSVEEIDKLPKEIALRIFDKLDIVKDNPEHFIEKLVDIPEFKIRVGDYRVILLYEKANNLIKIQAVGHRKNIYKRYKTD